MGSSDLIKTLNYHVVPPVFLVLFTVIVQYLVAVGNPEKPFDSSHLLGNEFAWKFIGSVLAWAVIWLWIPGKTFHGPSTNFGYVPVYKANGELYYFASLGIFGIIAYIKPRVFISIYENIGPILGGLNLFALALCLFLLVKAKLKKNEKDPYLLSEKFPLPHEFYRGMELHPRIAGLDVKQLTNCRIGLMLWQWLVLIYFGAACQLHGFDGGHFASTVLQSVYLYKFYHWETGYFNTLDITLDRAGYYICWGCLVWVPTFYTYSSYYFVYNVPNCNNYWTGAILFLGIASIYFNYDVDRQKELFRTSKDNKCQIWGRQAEFVKVSYKMADGTEKESKLLTSGWWGVARKINYTFELLAAFLWCFPAGFQYKAWPFLYFLFLFGLLVHRIFRDEKKCKAKYGKGWARYCKEVPYRLIPYIF